MTEIPPLGSANPLQDPELAFLRFTHEPEGSLSPHFKLLKRLAEANIPMHRTGAEKIPHQELLFRLQNLISQFPDHLHAAEKHIPLSTADVHNDFARVHGDHMIQMLCSNFSIEEIHAQLFSLDASSSDQKEVTDFFRHTLRDLPRTRGYAEAVKDAVTIQSKKKDAVSVGIVGCGAFPLTAIIAALSSQKSEVVCYEKNMYAATLAKMVISSLGLSERIHVISSEPERLKNTFDVICCESIGNGFTSAAFRDAFVSLHGDPDCIRVPKMIRIQASVLSLAEISSSNIPYVVDSSRIPYAKIVVSGSGSSSAVYRENIPTARIDIHTHNALGRVVVRIPLSRGGLGDLRDSVVWWETSIILGPSKRNVLKSCASHLTLPRQIFPIAAPVVDMTAEGVFERNGREEYAVLIEYVPNGEESFPRRARVVAI